MSMLYVPSADVVKLLLLWLVEYVLLGRLLQLLLAYDLVIGVAGYSFLAVLRWKWPLNSFTYCRSIAPGKPASF